MGRFIDLTGKRFGRLAVVSRGKNHKSGNAMWNCVCDCGTFCTVRGESLRSGHTLSCGCLRKERALKANKKYNEFRIVGDLVFVKLSNSDKEMITDKDIWNSELAKYCWWLDNGGYASARDKNHKSVQFHVLAFPNCPDGLIRDHIDGNTLNNTSINIRFVTHSQNMQNRKKQKNNRSTYVGVSFYSKSQKWRAQIKISGETIYLDSFSDIQDAIAAREAAEIKYFGEYRRKK